MTDQSSHYLRFPHLHGDLVTFVAEDDVWLAPLSGGRAWRVSSLGLPAKNPRFSPDGSKLLWTVIQGSVPELVCVPVAGGDLQRLTWFGHASTKFRGFTPDGSALVASAFEQPESSLTLGYAVSTTDGSRSQLPYGPIDSIAYGPVVGDEKPLVISSPYSREPAWWKRYGGGTAGKLWVDRDGSGEFVRLLPELQSNLVDPMWIGDRIAFLSDHEGYGNLYSVKPNGKKLRRHTDHEGFYVRHASTDGQRVVFESAGHLFLMDGLDVEPVQLNIELGSAANGRRKSPLNAAKHLAELRPDQRGRASLVETHGTIHLLTHQDGPSRTIEATPGVRARLARPLGADQVIYLADHGGAESIYLAPLDPVLASSKLDRPAAGASQNNQFSQNAASNGTPDSEPDTDLPKPVSASSVNHSAESLGVSPARSSASPLVEGAAPGVPARSAPSLVEPRKIDVPNMARASALETSPDGKYAAIGTEHGHVLLLDVAAGTLRQLAASTIGAIDELAFSPDSLWLVWSEPTSAGSDRAQIRLASVAGGDPIDATDGRFRDFSPSFTPDGKFIAFLSRRSFDPVYDTHNFDLAFPQAIKPYLLALAAKTPSPFGPVVSGVELGKPSSDEADGEESSSNETGAGDSPAKTTIDVAGLPQRIIGIPVAQGNYRDALAVDGGLLWLNGELAGVSGDGKANIADPEVAPRLERFEYQSHEITVLVDEADSFQLSGDGQKLVVRHESKVRVMPSDKKSDEKSQDNVKVDLSRIRVTLDPVKVWGQAFDEAWRLQRDFYWTEDMAGIDWSGVYDSYRPIVDRLGSADDLVDLLWELHGELGTSHAYVKPRVLVEPGTRPQGRLGAQISQTEAGWTVQSVLPGESSDSKARSPFEVPGAAIEPGDVIMAIDGVELTAAGPDPLLAGAAGKIVELTVRNGEGHGEKAGFQRRVAIVPIADEDRLRYQDWVSRNRKFVRDASQNQFGYLHVPDMQAWGWAQLHRDLDSEFSKDAVVIDVRRNRGGHTSQLVAELIGRKVSAWTRSRAVQDQTYPAFSPRGPVVILTDEFAGSDGDIITQVAKIRGIGPVIGMRTWGGVVGIDAKFSLADGTLVTQSRYAFWFSGGVGWSVENYGVDPDIEVQFPPQAHAAGIDPQLEYGLGVLREMLSEIPTDRAPAHSGYRNLRPGALPPRPQVSE